MYRSTAPRIAPRSSQPKKAELTYAHGCDKSLAPLEFRGSQNQSNDEALIHFFHRVVKTRLQNLRIFQARFESALSGCGDLIVQENLNRLRQRGFGIGKRVFAEDRFQINRCAVHFVASKGERKIEAVEK